MQQTHTSDFVHLISIWSPPIEKIMSGIVELLVFEFAMAKRINSHLNHFRILCYYIVMAEKVANRENGFEWRPPTYCHRPFINTHGSAMQCGGGHSFPCFSKCHSIDLLLRNAKTALFFHTIFNNCLISLIAIYRLYIHDRKKSTKMFNDCDGEKRTPLHSVALMTKWYSEISMNRNFCSQFFFHNISINDNIQTHN